jgi:glycosyltransferase involved in cell wall biosynthesis
MVDWRNECVVVIPCFNEAEHLAALLEAVKGHLPNIMVVDDGSNDDTALTARSTGVEVLQHEANLGKGAALDTGMRHALQRGFRWVLTMDGDGQHEPADIAKFQAAAEKTHAGLIIGNRMGNPEGMPLVRRIVNRWMSRRISRRARLVLPDSQCGFRLIELKSWAKLELHSRHFEIESEMLLAFVAAGVKIEFVPVQVLYTSTHSKINPFLDTLRWCRWWWVSRNTVSPARGAIANGSTEALPRPQQNARARV